MMRGAACGGSVSPIRQVASAQGLKDEDRETAAGERDGGGGPCGSPADHRDVALDRPGADRSTRPGCPGPPSQRGRRKRSTLGRYSLAPESAATGRSGVAKNLRRSVSGLGAAKLAPDST